MDEAARWLYRYRDNERYRAKCIAEWMRDYGDEFVRCVERECQKLIDKANRKGAKHANPV